MHRWAGLIVPMMVMLVSCVVPEGPTRVLGEAEPLREGLGQLVLTWHSDPQDRAILGSVWASATADAYELLLIGSAGTQAFPLQLGSGQALAVEPGTYRAILLAGVKRTPGSSTAFLVGSALAEGVSISLGQRTNLGLTLRSIDIGLTVQGGAYWQAGVTVRAAGKSRNLRLGMSLAGALTTSRPRFKSQELWNGYREATTVSGSPNDWVTETTGNVPDTIPSLTVALVGAGLCFQNLDESWAPTAGATQLTWSWPNRADIAETHPLAPWSELIVGCGPPPTGLEVSVGWE